MKIVTCFKFVPDERDITMDADRNVDTSSAPLSIGTYDLNAVEAGALLADADDSVELIALTAGTNRCTASKLKKDILARGPQKLMVVEGESFANADPVATAEALAAAVKHIGDVDLVLCGEGSGDSYSQQVGIILGRMLGLPTVNAVASMALSDGTLEAERTLEESVETIQIDLPCVVSVTSDINTPRITGMKAILAAGKKPAESIPLSDIVPGQSEYATTVSLQVPEKAERKTIVFEDASETNLEEFFQALRSAIA